MSKAYFIVNGVRYFGYDLLTADFSESYKGVVVNRSLRDEIDNPNSSLVSNLFSTFLPNKGDEINLIPKCPLAIDDVRKNYKVKRGYDVGVCNVFPPLPITYCTPSKWGYSAVIPSKKTILVFNDWSHRNDVNYMMKHVIRLFPGIAFSDIILSDHTEDIYWIDVPEAYIKLFDGTLTKPAIYYTKLPLNTSNELTKESLQIAYKVCSKVTAGGCEPSKDEESAVIIELNALNNYNWREYPGTMFMIFNTILLHERYDWRHNKNVYEHMWGHSSRYSKVVRSIMDMKSSDFISDKDIKMAQDFLKLELGMGDRKFVRLGDLKDKLDAMDMTLQDFDKVFTSVVRIEEKKVEKNEEED